MVDSRQHILAKLGTGIPQDASEAETILPAFDTTTENLAERLKQKLEAVHASVDLVSSTTEAAHSIANFLERHNSEFKVGVLPSMDVAPFALDKKLEFYECEDFAACQSVIVQAPYAIAETGTVLLPSSLERPTLANFLPDNCIVLVNEADIVPYLEQGLAQIKNSDEGMPRALNMISGPSKTADIEQTLVYGAHGPIQLHVIVRLR